MDDPRAAQKLDPLLEPILVATTDEDRHAQQQKLVVEVAQPLVRRLVSGFQRSEPLSHEDASELNSTILLRFVKKMQSLTATGPGVVANVAGYLATVAYNALYDLRRERFPDRTRLKNRLRYLLTHDPRLALWSTREATICGLSQWKGQTAFVGSLDARELPNRVDGRQPRNQAAALVAILTHVNAPVSLDELVRAVSDLWHIAERTSETPAPDSVPVRDQLQSLETREYMERLWQEIGLLPLNQRTALLLNFRDATGNNALGLFLILGLATSAELAEAIGMDETRLEELWPELPLGDLAIAERLQSTRQQVINLRRSARDRLGRRMARLR